MAESSLGSQAKEQSYDPKVGEHGPQHGSQEEEQSSGENVEKLSLKDSSKAGDVPPNQSAVSDPQGQSQLEGQPNSPETVPKEEQRGRLEKRPSRLSRSSSKKPKSILRRSNSSLKGSGRTKTVKLDIPEDIDERPRLPKDFYKFALTRYPRGRSWSEPCSSEADDESEGKSSLPSRRPHTKNPLFPVQSAPGDFGMTRDDALMTREEAEYLGKHPQRDSRGFLALPAENHKIEAAEKKRAAAAAARSEELRPGLLDIKSPPPTNTPYSPSFRSSRPTIPPRNTQPVPLSPGPLDVHSSASPSNSPRRQDSAVDTEQASQERSTPRLQESLDAIEMATLPAVSAKPGKGKEPATTKVTEARGSSSYDSNIPKEKEEKDNNQPRSQQEDSRQETAQGDQQGNRQGNDGQTDQPENQNNQDGQQGNQQANNQQRNNQPEARK